MIYDLKNDNFDNDSFNEIFSYVFSEIGESSAVEYKDCLITITVQNIKPIYNIIIMLTIAHDTEYPDITLSNLIIRECTTIEVHYLDENYKLIRIAYPNFNNCNIHKHTRRNKLLSCNIMQ